jgi:exonuclease III
MYEFEIEEIKNNVFDSIEDCKILLQGENNSINTLMINIRSMRRNWDTLMGMISNILIHIHLLILLEINVKEDELKLFEINDFNIIAKCREAQSGGGIAIYYRNYINVNILDSAFYSTESLILELSIEYQKIIIAAFYRPPSSSILDFNRELENWLTTDKINNNKNLIVLGDINIDIINNHNKSTTVEYLNILNSMGIQMCIKTPTREE